MRVLRLRLANYRGIDESEVRFGPKGLTIVEGANEAGKTSLSEAIRLLYDYLDSSRHTDIKAIKPERGSEKKEVQEAKKSQEKSETEVASLEKQIRDLEKDIVRAAELGRELERLKRQEEDLRGDVSEYTKSLDEIKGLETVLETARLKLESAKKSEQAAKRDKEVRQDLIEAVAKAGKAHTKLDESAGSSTASARKAENDLEKAQSDATKAEGGRKKAESHLTLRRADFDYFNNKLHLEQLRERKDRIDRARKEAALADELLAKNSVDEATLKTIQKVERSFITAQAKLETGAPNVLLRGLANLDFQIDGKQTTLSKDEEINLSISGRVRVTIPGSLHIEVRAGAGSSDLAKKVEEAKQKLDAVYSDVGVSNADEARQSYDARREARQSLARQKEIVKENLRDLTYEELVRKVMGMEKSVPAYPTDRIPEPRLPENMESAKKELRSAEAGFEKANKAGEEAVTELDAARKVRDGLREQHTYH